MKFKVMAPDENGIDKEVCEIECCNESVAMANTARSVISGDFPKGSQVVEVQPKKEGK